MKGFQSRTDRLTKILISEALLAVLFAICCFQDTDAQQNSAINRHQASASDQPLGGPVYPDSVRLYYAALAYDGVDPVKGCDTMRLYCRLHPFAETSPGQLLTALHWTNDFVAEQPNVPLHPDDGYDSPVKWMIQYNWLIDQFALNPDTTVEGGILLLMGGAASAFDRNLSCNLFYNFERYKPDSGWKANCVEGITEIRRFQHGRGEDTTAFTPVTIPPKKVVIPGGSAVATHPVTAPSLTLSISPDPAQREISLHIEGGYGLSHGEIYSVAGIEMLPLFNRELAPGRSDDLRFDISTLPSGTYYLRVQSPTGTVTKKLIIAK